MIFFEQDATFTEDKDNFIICAQEERQPQVSIDLTTLRSRVRCVTATLISCA